MTRTVRDRRIVTGALCASWLLIGVASAAPAAANNRNDTDSRCACGPEVVETTKRVPERYRQAVIPHIVVDNAAAAIDFYRRAFGACTLLEINFPDGRVLHAELQIEGALFMLGDAVGGDLFQSPKALNGSSVGLHVYVQDVDAIVARAVREGAQLLQPPQDMFYGDRSAIVKDPYGHFWVFLTHKQDMSLAEIERQGEALLEGAKH